ncbi:hypothetical protein MASR2M15_06140 [Anaerolineales bacterium]
MAKELVMYNRSTGCPFSTIAKRVLNEQNIAYREIFIDEDIKARQQVLNWTGFLSIPTLVVAEEGEIMPYYEPAVLEKGQSPRGIDRGSMITEAKEDELITFLQQNGFIDSAE